MRKRSRFIAVAATVAALSLVGGIFASLAKAAEPDYEVVATDLGEKSRIVEQNGTGPREFGLRIYGTKLDQDGDGDLDADAHRAVIRVRKRVGVLRIQINKVRLQRQLYVGGPWETVASEGVVNTGNVKLTAKQFNDPPVKEHCGLQRYRAQSDGLTRFVDNDLDSWGIASDVWFGYGVAGDCQLVPAS